MITLFFIIIGLIFLLGLILFVVSFIQKKQYGVLTNERIYQDSAMYPGKVLKATSINLVGKPDYLLKEKGQVVPVEVKRGKTPSYPYVSHIMQLTAYCLLVEENFGRPPSHGYVKYPYQEFKVEYTDGNKEKLIELVKTLTYLKTHDSSFSCKHPEHNLKN